MGGTRARDARSDGAYPVSCFQSRVARENARQLSRVPSMPETTSGPSFDSDYFPKAPIKSWHLGAPALLTMGMFISSIK